MLVIAALFAYSFFGFKVFLYVGLLVASLAVYLVINQESILYVPKIANISNVRQNPVGMRSPAERGLKFDSLSLTTSDGERIHAWYIPAREEASAPTVLFLHANAGNMGLRMDLFEQLHRVTEANVLAIDYRGYGDSSGKPSEEGLLEDARTALAWLRERAEAGHLPKGKIYLFGRSLGGAVAVALALAVQEEAPAPVCGVLLENTFTSIPDIVDHQFSWLAWGFVKRHLLRLKYNTLEKVPKLRVPILFIAGEADEIVPHVQMQRLSKAAAHATLHVVPGGQHNDTWAKAGQKYWTWIRDFFDATAPR